MNRSFQLYLRPVLLSSISDSTVKRSDKYTLAELTLQKTVYGHITDIAPDENFDTQKVVQPRMLSIQCRWFSELNTNWLLYYSNMMFDIISARELGTKQYWEIRAKMSIGQLTLPDGGGLP
jgi:hypothetical protein